MDLSRYIDLFLEESRSHLEAAHGLHAALHASPVDAKLWRQFMRHAHSLKGMAASMQFESIVRLTHAAEGLAERSVSADERQAHEYLTLIEDSLVCLGEMLDAVEQGGEPVSPDAERLANELRASGGEPEVERSEPRRLHSPAAPSEATAHWTLELRFGSGDDSTAQHAVGCISRLGEIARVVQSAPPSLTLDGERFVGLVQLTLESGSSHERLQEDLTRLLEPESFTLRPAPAPAPARARGDRRERWVRVPSAGLDAMVEALLEIRQEQAKLKSALGQRDRAAMHHLQCAELRQRELYASLIELRLVPFDTVAQQLRHTVRELARELGKEVRFEIEGAELRLDRSILDALVAPLQHALRNAVDHAVEPPRERLRIGKSRRGHVRLQVERDGERVRFQVSDDGRGMLPERLRKAAVDCGALNAEEAAELTDEEALLLTTLPRLTTRSRADLVSGRGVGLDIVRDSVEQLGGFVEVRSNPGAGTELRLSVPMSRALVQTLLVRSAGRIFAVPIASIARCATLASSEPPEPPADLAVRWIELDRSLGLEPDRNPAADRWALHVLGAAVETAIVVDELLCRQDLVLQPLHAPLAHLRHYAGAGLLPDGGIVLALDPTALGDRRDALRLG